MSRQPDRAAIRDRVKQIIASVTRIPVERIGDDAAFREDLGLDSLSMLEIGVDVDQEFALGIEDLDQRLGTMPRLGHVVDFVESELQEREGA